MAQTTPVSEFQQQRHQEETSPAPTGAGLAPDERRGKAPLAEQRRLWVSGFLLSGVEKLDSTALTAELEHHAGRQMTAEELRQTANLVADRYLREGMLASVRIRAISSDGLVDMRVTELKMGVLKLDIPPQARVTESLARRFLDGLVQTGEMIPMSRLEAAVTTLNTLPGIAAAIAVDAGQQPDQANVTVQLRDRPMLSGQVDINNHGLRDIGQGHLDLNLRADNIIGMAERATLGLSITSDSHIVSPSFSLPIGNRGMRGGLEYTNADYRSRISGAAMNLSGEFDYWRAFARRPLIRDKNLSLNAELGFQQTNWHDDSIFGELHRREIDGVSLSLTGQHRGQNTHERFRLELLSGHADLRGNTDDYDQDAISSRIQGYFLRLNWRVTHERPLAGGRLQLRAAGQWSNRNLDASQQFSLGGPDQVRAYPTLEAPGDHGYTATAEWQHALGETIMGRAFFDTGWIRRYANPWDEARNHYHLSSAGLGTTWQPQKSMQFSLDGAWQVGNNPQESSDGSDSDGRRDHWRIWAALQRSF